MYFRAKLKEKLRVRDAFLEVQVSAGHLALGNVLIHPPRSLRMV